MNIAYIKDVDRKFLMQASRFCRNIDRYKDILGLSRKEIELFKNELAAMLLIAENYKTFSTSFILYNISSLRKKLGVMAIVCKRNKYYTRKTGLELGIEVAEKINAKEILETDVYPRSQN